VVQCIYSNLLYSPLVERRRDPQRWQHHLLAAPDRPEVYRGSRWSGEPRSRKKSPSATPRGPIPLMDQVGEAFLCLLVYGFDAEHLGSG
jgi:hypothetical protein